MDKVTVGSTTYRIRKYTPKRRGEHAGHGWIRETVLLGKPHGAEVGVEIKALVDEVVRLRLRIAELEALVG